MFEIILITGLITIIFSINSVSASNVGLIESSQWQSNLTGVRFSATAFGDIDNDGDLDLALSGCLGGAGANRCTAGAITKIYINNGSTLIESIQWQENLTGVGWSSILFGDIDNDGYLDLVLSGCTNASDQGSDCNGGIISKIYINNGTSLIENMEWQQNLTAIYDSSIAINDINNDGKIDLALVGLSASSRIAKVYINNGTTLMESIQWQNNLTGINEGQINFGDVDNDGDLDLALTGEKGSATDYTNFYLNNGTSFIESTQWNTYLVNMDRSSLSFGNYNNDQYLDLMVCGHTNGDECKIYKNNGTTLSINQSETDIPAMPGLYRASFAFGDYDNDGDLDFFAMGHEDGRTKTYENNETNYYHFQNDALAHANISNDIVQGAVAWGDLDNDRDLDLIITSGDVITGIISSKIFINNNTILNTQPSAPNSSFSSTYINNIFILSWSNGSDAETNISGLYYNLMVGNSTTNHTIVSGVYGGSSGGGGGAGGGASGYFGNMMQRKSIALNVQLEANKTYYWYVQTIDTGLAKSNWSAMQSFTTSLDVTKPSITIDYPSPNESLHTTNPFFIFNATVTDANLTNVTLYANWTGSMIANETNSSGLNGTYTFNRNLTNINDGMYSWYIQANDSSNNSQSSETRSFYLDRAYPLVYLESPANSSSWTSSSTVTFTYNVTDTDIANCSLIIDNSIDQTDTSITEDTTQSFTKSLANGNYNWNVNCSDYVGYTNKSETRSLIVSYTAPCTNCGGGGGGGGAILSKNITTQPKKFDIDFSKTINGSFEAKQGDIKIFSFNGEILHEIVISEIINNSIRIIIKSESIILLLSIGETKQVDINKDSINDFEIKLVSIINGMASFSLKKLAGADIVAKEELEEAVRKEALFDVKVYILDKFKEVFPGEEVSAKIEVFNINNIGQVDVIVDYYLSDSNLSNGTILAKGFDTLAVEAVASFVRSLITPEDLEPGIYYFNVDVSYKNFTTSGNTAFRVKSTKLRFIEKRWKEIVIIGIGVAALIAITVFFYLRMIKKREEKIEREEQKIRKKESKLEKKEERLEGEIKKLRGRK